MKKILLAIDAIAPDMAALDFACYLGRLTHSYVTGVFLENLAAEERPVLKQAHGMHYLDWQVDEQSDEYIAKSKLVEKNISMCREACINRGVHFKVHRDRGVPAREIIDESRYADLIIADASTSFKKIYEGSPTEFVRDVLKDAECPVLIAPERFDGVDQLIFTYNGSSSSMFAIRQFTYLFPEFRNKQVIILQVSEDGHPLQADKYKFREWLKEHYMNINFEESRGTVTAVLMDYLFTRKNSFVVMGAYGRSAVSLFFKKSHADLLIKTVTQPIFITHY